MTEEEVTKGIAYCDEDKISHKEHLSELGINPWNLYDAKRRYAQKEGGENTGGCLQLMQVDPSQPNLALRPVLGLEQEQCFLDDVLLQCAVARHAFTSLHVLLVSHGHPYFPKRLSLRRTSSLTVDLLTSIR